MHVILQKCGKSNLFFEIFTSPTIEPVGGSKTKLTILVSYDKKHFDIQFDNRVIKLLEEIDSLLRDAENEHIKRVDNLKYDRNVITVEINRTMDIVQNMAEDIRNITSVTW